MDPVSQWFANVWNDIVNRALTPQGDGGVDALVKHIKDSVDADPDAKAALDPDLGPPPKEAK